MDLDRFIATNQPTWVRLEELADRARRGPKRLSANELDELVALYQRTSANLAFVRTRYDDVTVMARLSRILGLARGTIYRGRSTPGRTVGRFFREVFPAAVWHSRRAIAVAAFLLLAPALAVGLWLGNDHRAREVAIPSEVQQVVADREFADYYRSAPASEFQTSVTTNNIQVSFLAFATGVLLGIPTVLLLVQNGASIGVMGAVMHAHGKGALFWGLVLPHGLLELSSVIVAGGAGLMLAWSIISPGDRSRAVSLAEQALRTVTIVLGLVLCFCVAGFTEAWVTPSGLPTWARVGFGVLIEATFVAYVVGFGRAAAARGLTGRFGEVPLDEAVAVPARPTNEQPATSLV